MLDVFNKDCTVPTAVQVQRSNYVSILSTDVLLKEEEEEEEEGLMSALRDNYKVKYGKSKTPGESSHGSKRKQSQVQVDTTSPTSPTQHPLSDKPPAYPPITCLYPDLNLNQHDNYHNMNYYCIGFIYLLLDDFMEVPEPAANHPTGASHPARSPHERIVVSQEEVEVHLTTNEFNKRLAVYNQYAATNGITSAAPSRAPSMHPQSFGPSMSTISPNSTYNLVQNTGNVTLMPVMNITTGAGAGAAAVPGAGNHVSHQVSAHIKGVKSGPSTGPNSPRSLHSEISDDPNLPSTSHPASNYPLHHPNHFTYTVKRGELLFSKKLNSLIGVPVCSTLRCHINYQSAAPIAREKKKSVKAEAPKVVSTKRRFFSLLSK